jgi:hypothetical protein
MSTRAEQKNHQSDSDIEGARVIMRIARIAVVSLAVSHPIFAQQGPTASQAAQPQTKLEAFQRQVGSVVVKGFLKMGSVGEMGAVSVECMEFVNATTGKKQTGIVIEVEGAGRTSSSDRSFIDYDEIDSLLKGIDYISRVKQDVTSLGSFKATYKTRGDLTVTSFSSNEGKIEAAVTSGHFRGATAYIPLVKLSQLSDLVLKAKQRLDKLK